MIAGLLLILSGVALGSGVLRPGARPKRRAGAPVNVSIRRARPDDADFLVELMTHDEVDPYLSARRSTTREEILEEIERSETEPERYGRFIVVLDGEPAGAMGSASRTSAAGSHPSAGSRSIPITEAGG